MRNDPPPKASELYIPRKATSIAWKTFRLSRHNPTHVWCTVCQVWLSWKKTTSNLLLHCNSRHSSINPLRKRRHDEPPPLSRTKPRLTPICDVVKEIAGIVVEDFLHVGVVNGRGFKRFVGMFVEGFVEAGSRELFRELKVLHGMVNKGIERLLAGGVDGGLALRVEVWGEGKYASVVGGFGVEGEFEVVDVVLGISYCGDLGVGREEFVGRAVEEALKVWRLDGGCVVSVTTELKSGRKLLQRCGGVKTHLSCIATRLNEIMREQLKVDAVNDLMSKVFKAIGANEKNVGVKSWVFQARLLNEISRGVKLGREKIVVDCILLPNVLKLNAEVFRDGETLFLIHSLADLLSPLADVADRFATAPLTPALSLVWHVIEKTIEITSKLAIAPQLHKVVKDIAYNIARELFAAISEFAADEAEATLLCATLDPRLKTTTRDPNSKEGVEALTLLRRHYENQRKTKTCNPLDSTANGSNASLPLGLPPCETAQVNIDDNVRTNSPTLQMNDREEPRSASPPALDNSDSFNYFPPLTFCSSSSPLASLTLPAGRSFPSMSDDQAMCATQNSSATPSPRSDTDGSELSRYFSEPSISMDADPCKWWEEHAKQYPTLAQIARRVFAIPSMCVKASRAFPISIVSRESDGDREREMKEKREFLARHPDVDVEFVKTIAYLNANRKLANLFDER